MYLQSPCPETDDTDSHTQLPESSASGPINDAFRDLVRDNRVVKPRRGFIWDAATETRTHTCVTKSLLPWQSSSQYSNSQRDLNFNVLEMDATSNPKATADHRRLGR
ncbi:hypothetical protein K239x_57500 [Planctomycetes bacterium K23_9]|uniref:Uncharacterized protein n=1 Tax=Stieleria marina TaxID=1930275 RepID=A0A517P2X6_9BACT|nr:hypothetical protein K239x_57500 [Planctomycetes bacterium K23_9]